MTEGYSSKCRNQEKAEITKLLESAQGRHGLVGHAGMERSGELFVGNKQTSCCCLLETNKQVIYSMRRWGRSSGTGGTAREVAGTEKRNL